MQNRQKICILCMRKATCIISEVVACQLRIYVLGLENYGPGDPQLPESICGACRIKLGKIAKGQKEATSLPNIFNYKSIIVSYDEINQ